METRSGVPELEYGLGEEGRSKRLNIRAFHTALSPGLYKDIRIALSSEKPYCVLMTVQNLLTFVLISLFLFLCYMLHINNSNLLIVFANYNELIFSLDGWINKGLSRLSDLHFCGVGCLATK